MKILKLIFVSLVLMASSVFASVFASEVAISNMEAQLPKVMTLEELRAYFMLKKTMYPNGVRVQIFLLSKDTVTSRNFLLNVLNISPSSYYDMVESQVSTGRSNLPIIVESDTRMVISVAINKGGLGLIRDAAYTINLTSINIIEVK